MENNKKHTILLLILFMLVIATRLIPINFTYSEDEMNLPIILEGQKFVDTSSHAHPPLGQILYKLFSLIFGTSLPAIRLFPLLISIFNVYFIYLIASTSYGRKTAMYSLIFSLLSFHLLLTSSLVSIDPLVLTATLIFIYLLQNESGFDNRFVLFMGSLLGISMLIKYQFVILYPVLLIYHFLHSRSFYKSLILMIRISLVSIFIFSAFPILSYLIDPMQFVATVNFLSDYRASMYESLNFPFGSVFVFLAIFTTPLFIGLSILQAFKLEKRDYLHIILISVTLLFYLFIVKRGDFSRYLITIVPSLIILSASYINGLNLNRQSIKVIIVSSLVTLFSSYLISASLLSTSIIPTKLIGSYFMLLKSFSLNFLFPLNIDHGYWVSINVALLIIISLFMLIIFLYSLITSNRKLSLFSLLVFVGIGIGYNIYLSSEYLFHVTQPNPDAAIKDMLTYFNRNNLSAPVYTNDKSFYYALGKLGNTGITYDSSDRIRNINKLRSSINSKGGTILYLNFASHVSKEDIFSLPSCKVLHEFRSKGITMSYVLSCIPSEINT